MCVKTKILNTISSRLIGEPHRAWIRNTLRLLFWATCACLVGACSLSFALRLRSAPAVLLWLFLLCWRFMRIRSGRRPSAQANLLIPLSPEIASAAHRQKHLRPSSLVCFSLRARRVPYANRLYMLCVYTICSLDCARADAFLWSAATFALGHLQKVIKMQTCVSHILFWLLQIKFVDADPPLG